MWLAPKSAMTSLPKHASATAAARAQNSRRKPLGEDSIQPERAGVVDLTIVDPVRCPCGWARRAFADRPGSPASVHRVEIDADAIAHYHRTQTEIYYILECGADAAVELDGERVAVRPGSAVLIPPGVRHRAVGRMTILNVVVPPFSQADEWFD
jgi:mannose-6-phosphate isomerase-like protein (cupin superfamily)